MVYMLPLRMDTVFFPVGDSDRSAHLHSLRHSLGCSYICLWFYSPQPTDHLSFLDGYYHEENNQPGSSAPSLSRRLFNEYRQQMFYLINGRVPGTAFLNNQPYQELNEFDLQRMVSNEVQRQFYQEARIKTAVFMGCRSGEIEMGWSNNGNQINMENAIRGWFSDDINRHQSPLRELSQPVDVNRLSSTSSSSLRSLSMDSPESSSLLFNLSSSTTHITEGVSLEPPIMPSASTAILQVLQYLHPIEAMQSLQQQLPSTTAPLLHHQQPVQPFESVPATTTSPHQQAFALTRNLPLPTQESVDAAMTRAILAVLTSSSSPRSRSSAFKKYSAPAVSTRQNLQRQTMLKRSLTYYTRLNSLRGEQMQANRPTSTQLHHMISERKRREKINESFDQLRKLLPPEAKKDKASVLARTRQYLASLKDQVAELSERNKKLEAQLLPGAIDPSEASSGRVNVRITHETESTSEDQERMINLQVVLRGESSVADMVIRILEFLRQDRNVSLMSMEASSHLQESRSFNRVILRLRIEGNEWDESAFQEAIRRVVADLI